MDTRTWGLRAALVGLVAQAAGLGLDAWMHANDPSLAEREGVFTLTNAGHALFFGGIVLAGLGVLMALFGGVLYGRREAPARAGLTVARIGVPVVVVLVLVAGVRVASSSSLAGGHHHDEAESGHTHDEGEHADGHTHAAAGPSDDHEDDHGHADQHGDVITGAVTGDSACERSGPPSSPGQVAADSEGHGARGPLRQEPLTREERTRLEEQQAQARAAAARFPTVADALAAGYRMSTPYVPCIGAHYTNSALVVRFDPAAPSELLYDGTAPDSRIVGLSYLVWHPGGPPEGFAGPNDHWHQHNFNGGLCFKGGVVVGGEAMSREQCARVGGVKREMTDIWMVHDWVVPGWECSWGVFGGECPELGGRTAGTAWDPPAARGAAAAGS